jgi:uncharacterized protein
MRDALYAIAKAPRPGLAKTRLARSLGEEDALLLYRAFLADLAKRFGSTPYGLGWYVTPRDAWPEIRELTGETGPVLFQGEGDLTERQRGLFHAAFGEGAERVVLIAADSPHLPVRVVEDAFGMLEERDVVLGPTLDGGYYLIGMRGWRDFPREVPMSTATVLEDVLAGARRSGLSVGLTERTFDVDVVGDLRHLCREVAADPDLLPATREALGRIGLPDDILEGDQAFAQAETP